MRGWGRMTTGRPGSFLPKYLDGSCKRGGRRITHDGLLHPPVCHCQARLINRRLSALPAYLSLASVHHVFHPKIFSNLKGPWSHVQILLAWLYCMVFPLAIHCHLGLHKFHLATVCWTTTSHTIPRFLSLTFIDVSVGILCLLDI